MSSRAMRKLHGDRDLFDQLNVEKNKNLPVSSAKYKLKEENEEKHLSETDSISNDVDSYAALNGAANPFDVVLY